MENQDICVWLKPKESKRWWETGCGNNWMLEEWESPKINRINFCPICGRKCQEFDISIDTL
jgi:hypothetical protein